MNRFWRSWLAGDFEQLVKYKISVANGAALATFNTQHRARYVRCKESVAASIKERTDSASRYQVDDNIAQSIEHSAKVLQGSGISRSISLTGFRSIRCVGQVFDHF